MVCDIENIKLAHHNARKGKTYYKQVKMVDEDIDFYAKQIRQMLITKTYKVSPYTPKLINDGRKEREVKVLPYYPDRIVQWAMMQILLPIFKRHFIYDSYSSVVGKGIHQAIPKIERYVRQNDYVLQIDIRKFYQSIDNDILKTKVRRLIKDKDLLWLIDLIIDSDKGLPIGNYTSQYLANLYLTGLDHKLKEIYKARYIRYMDDLILFGNKNDLRDLLNVIRHEISEMKLDIKLYKIVRLETNEIDFCGYRYKKGYIKLRTTNKKSIKDKQKRLRKLYSEHNRLSLISAVGMLAHLKNKNLYRRVENEISKKQRKLSRA